MFHRSEEMSIAFVQFIDVLLFIGVILPGEIYQIRDIDILLKNITRWPLKTQTKTKKTA